jgi:hypothetical protein
MGALEVACFEWVGDDGRLSHTTKLTYSFRRKDSEAWETSEYLPNTELLAAAKLFDLAHTAVHDRLDQAIRARRDAGRDSEEPAT